jgi:hypothetical protein
MQAKGDRADNHRSNQDLGQYLFLESPSHFSHSICSAQKCRMEALEARGIYYV